MNQPKRRIDRVEAFASAVDAFEPARLTNEADLFRSFARRSRAPSMDDIWRSTRRRSLFRPLNRSWKQHSTGKRAILWSISVLTLPTSRERYSCRASTTALLL